MSNTSVKGSILAFVCSFISLASFAAGAEMNSPATDSNPHPLVTSSQDGNKALEKLMNRAQRLGPYKFRGVLSTVKEKDNELFTNSGNFYYMPQSQLRVEVLGGGYKSGSVLVKERSGEIRAKGGRALLGMKMSLQPDSNLLTLPNGLSILKCDYISLLEWLKTQVASGEKIYASDSPIYTDKQGTKLIVLETREPSGVFIAHRLLIDPQLYLPVQWDIFKEGKFFSTVRFDDFQLCPSMDESLFKL